MIDLYDIRFSTARRRGYITTDNAEEFELSFVGQWIIKNHNRIKELDVMTKVFGHAPEWNDFTDRNLKNLKNEVNTYLCANSASKMFSRIVAILNDMQNEVEIPCKRFADILKGKKEPSQAIFLTEVEIKALENINPATDEEQYVKCLYLLECYCGARHSDILNLTNENIKEVRDSEGKVVKRYVSYVSQKTRIQADIPLHRNFESCLNGYDRSIEMYDYEFNNILRDLCKRAGINEHTKLFRRGRWEEGEKWTFISTHSGRKSLCSNLYLHGVDTKTIAKLAGHSSSLTTEKTYIVPMRELSDNAMSFFN